MWRQHSRADHEKSKKTTVPSTVPNRCDTSCQLLSSHFTPLLSVTYIAVFSAVFVVWIWMTSCFKLQRETARWSNRVHCTELFSKKDSTISVKVIWTPRLDMRIDVWSADPLQVLRHAFNFLKRSFIALSVEKPLHRWRNLRAIHRHLNSYHSWIRSHSIDSFTSIWNVLSPCVNVLSLLRTFGRWRLIPTCIESSIHSNNYDELTKIFMIPFSKSDLENVLNVHSFPRKL